MPCILPLYRYCSIDIRNKPQKLQLIFDLKIALIIFDRLRTLLCYGNDRILFNFCSGKRNRISLLIFTGKLIKIRKLSTRQFRAFVTICNSLIISPVGDTVYLAASQRFRVTDKPRHLISRLFL